MYVSMSNTSGLGHQLESVLAGIDAQIADLERLILEKERWEIREEKREDTLAEEGRAGRLMSCCCHGNRRCRPCLCVWYRYVRGSGGRRGVEEGDGAGGRRAGAPAAGVIAHPESQVLDARTTPLVKTQEL